MMIGADESRIMYFRLNKPQANVLAVMAAEMWLLWGRGTGKTVGVIAPWILHKVEVMPRSNGGLIGQTFSDLESKILQPLFLAFGMLGYENDVHYVYGKKPPESWVKPLTPIIDYSHVMTFPNGTTMELISLHLKGSANAKSLQWIVGDEAKFLDEDQLRGEVFPILRGHVKHFGRSPWYGAKLFVTDKLSPSIHWILEKRKLVDHDLVGAVLFYQLRLNELQQKLEICSDGTRVNIRRKMRKLCRLLAVLRKGLVYVSEAKSSDNIENLGASYMDDRRGDMTDYEYRIAIENEDPTRVANGFYPNRTDENMYALELDDDITKPLAVALDYQASITPLVSCQLNDLVLPGVTTLNILQSIYVKQPLGLKHVIDNFCEIHRLRPCKHVLYFYDHTAVGERNMHKKFYEEVEGYFIDNGWYVTLVYMGKAPGHGNKYNRINHYLQNKNSVPYPIMIHKHRCSSLVLSMDQTGTLDTEGGTKKDKTSEKRKNFPQEQAPHLGDTFDMLVWGILEMNSYPATDFVSSFAGIR